MLRLFSATAISALILLGASPSTASETVTYTYDAQGRLVKVVHSGTVNNGEQVEYELDQADNRIEKTTTGA